MPNWCECTLVIEGPKKDLKRLKKTVQDRKEVIEARKIIPYPKKFAKLDRAAAKNNDKIAAIHTKIKIDTLPGHIKEEIYKNQPEHVPDGYNQGGYDWRINNWGTKWGFCHTELILDDKESLTYGFDTAWSPPCPLIKKLSRMFPTLNMQMEYQEGGCGFAGTFTAKNGRCTDEEKEPYREEEL